MSGAISGSVIGTYLAITKDEASYVTQQEKSDAPTLAAVAKLTQQAPGITSPTALLNNYSALQVILGAAGLSSAIGETGILTDLLTQDPSASTSLVQQTANTQYLAFAQSMASRQSVQFQLGSASALSVVTSGASASVFGVQNTAFAGDPAATSATNVARQWNFVLNDGGANASVADVLATAAGGGATYSVLSGGSVSGSAGAPPVAVSTDANGNKVYTLTTATDSTGAPTTQISVVSVGVQAAGATGASSQLSSLVTAMNNAGLDATMQANGSLTVIGSNLDRTGIPVFSVKAAIPSSTSSTVLAMGTTATGLEQGQMILDGSTIIGQVQSVDSQGNVTLTGAARAAVAAGDTLSVYNGLAVTTTATAATTTSATMIAMGSAGAALLPGQILRDGNTVLGTIASIDTSGNVKLTAPALASVAIGDTIGVAPSMTLDNVGVASTATQSAAAGSTTLALGPEGARYAKGQVIEDGFNVIGTVASVDVLGNVTLAAPSLAAVSAGDTILAVPPLAGTTTQALSDPQNLAALISQYKTNQYETYAGTQNLGMTQALYYNRMIGSVTSIDQLMSDPVLLSVVESTLGLPTAFGELSFDQQQATLTKDVDLSKFQDPDYVKTSAERYLELVQQNNPAQASSDSGLLSLFGSSSTDPASAILTLLGAPYTTAALPATSGNDQNSSSILSLFT